MAKGAAAPGSTSGAFKDRTTIQNVVYQAHMQDYGWYTTAFNGSTGGVTGAAKRMEALKSALKIQHTPVESSTGHMSRISAGRAGRAMELFPEQKGRNFGWKRFRFS